MRNWICENEKKLLNELEAICEYHNTRNELIKLRAEGKLDWDDHNIKLWACTKADDILYNRIVDKNIKNNDDLFFALISYVVKTLNENRLSPPGLSLADSLEYTLLKKDVLFPQEQSMRLKNKVIEAVDIVYGNERFRVYLQADDIEMWLLGNEFFVMQAKLLTFLKKFQAEYEIIETDDRVSDFIKQNF